MPTFSEFQKGKLLIGLTGAAPSGFTTGGATLTRVDIPDDGNPNFARATEIGNDLALTNINSTALAGRFKATKVFNAVWNDVADFQKLNDRLEFGRCYYDTKDGARICNSRCQESVIGIASDTFGFGVGSGNPNNEGKEVPIAVAGWTLAYVDHEYPAGTVLTNAGDGSLTRMSFWEKLFHPERIVAIYKKKETHAEFGIEKKIKVNGRHWVKVK